MVSRSDSADPRNRIVCVGEALIDLIAPQSESWGEFDTFLPRIGGAPANMSVAITRLGGRAGFLGCRADDDPGIWIGQCLASEGVDISAISIVPGSQTRLALVTGPAEQREFRFYGNPPADTQLTPEAVESAGPQDAAAVLVSSLLLTTEPSRSAMLRLLDLCKAHDVPLVFDPNPRPAIWTDPEQALALMEPFIKAAAILKLGAGEAELLGSSVRDIRLLQHARAILVVTDGRRGCHYWYGDERSVSVPSIPVESVDSTGAGDAFTAALALRFVENGRELDKLDVRFANVVGAMTTTREGAMDALPTRERVEQVLEAVAGR